MLKAPITKFVPWMRDKSTRPSQYPEQVSKDKYAPKFAITHNTRTQADNASDEEFILQDIGTVRKTTHIGITYEEGSIKSETGVGNHPGELFRD